MNPEKYYVVNESILYTPIIDPLRPMFDVSKIYDTIEPLTKDRIIKDKNTDNWKLTEDTEFQGKYFGVNTVSGETFYGSMLEFKMAIDTYYIGE